MLSPPPGTRCTGAWLITGILCVLLPLTGILITGRPIAPYFEFPPRTRYVLHAGFSLPVFILVLVILLVTVVMLALFLVQGRDRHRSTGVDAPAGRFPWWGYVGMLLTGASWVVAWNRFDWFAPFQAYTFTPLWLGYILVVNGLACWWRNESLLTRDPHRFLLLFPVSMGFWWYFEYLNRFVQNWYYVGIDDFSGFGYVVHASVCFSTVLPAVLSTHFFLLNPKSVQPGVENPDLENRILTNLMNARFGWFLLVCSGSGLAMLGIWPDYLFALLWVSPLLILTGLQLILEGRSRLLILLASGQGRVIVAIASFSALICGFFWEMWNWKSLAHWEYSIPFVDRYHLFAMPVLGYGGYLPFGLECYLLGILIYPNIDGSYSLSSLPGSKPEP